MLALNISEAPITLIFLSMADKFLVGRGFLWLVVSNPVKRRKSFFFKSNFLHALPVISSLFEVAAGLQG